MSVLERGFVRMFEGYRLGLLCFALCCLYVSGDMAPLAASLMRLFNSILIGCIYIRSVLDVCLEDIQGTGRPNERR